MKSRPFRLLVIAAVLLLVTLAVCRSAVGGSVGSSEAMLPFLIGAGALCLVGLTVRRQRTVAWLALIVCLATITLDLAAFGRQQRPVVGTDTWRWIACPSKSRPGR